MSNEFVTREEFVEFVNEYRHLNRLRAIRETTTLACLSTQIRTLMEHTSLPDAVNLEIKDLMDRMDKVREEEYEIYKRICDGTYTEYMEVKKENK